MKNKIQNIIGEHQSTVAKLLADESLTSRVGDIVEAMCSAFKSGGKVLFCGNGGSAADAQHLAAELSGRFYLNRGPLFAEALHVNSSYLTAVANDFSFDDIYARILEAKGKKNDVLIAMSTSGNSKNVLEAAKVAKQKGILLVGMTGSKSNALSELSDIAIQIPSTDTPRIQECHMLLGHIVCQLVEAKMFPSEK